MGARGMSAEEADDHWSEHGDRTPAQVWADDHDEKLDREAEEDAAGAVVLEEGGCPAHPEAGHFVGFGLAGGGFGEYKVCAAEGCAAVFDKSEWKDDEE